MPVRRLEIMFKKLKPSVRIPAIPALFLLPHVVGAQTTSIPAVYNAVPANPYAVASFNLDFSQSNPMFQSILNSLMIQGHAPIPFNAGSLRAMIPLVFANAHIEGGQQFADGLDLTVGVVAMGPIPGVNLNSGIVQKAPKKKFSKQAAPQDYLKNIYFIIHDSGAQSVGSAVDKLPPSVVQTKWWLGAKYHSLANSMGKISFMVDQDFLIIGENPRLFHYACDAIDRGNSILNQPAFQQFARSLSPSMVASMLFADTSKQAPSAGLMNLFSMRWRGLVLSAPTDGLKLSVFGPRLLSSDSEAAVVEQDELSSILSGLPGGRLLTLAITFPGGFMGFSKGRPLAVGLYPSHPNERGIPTSGNLLIVSHRVKKSLSQPMGFYDSIKNFADQLTQSNEGQAMKNLTIKGATEASELSKSAAAKFKGFLGRALAKTGMNMKTLLAGKTLAIARVGKSELVATSKGLLQKAATLISNEVPAEAPVTNRLVGLLSIEPGMLASVLDGLGVDGKPALHLPENLETIMKSATGPIFVQGESNQGFDTLTIDLPINWTILKQVVKKAVIADNK